MTQTFDPTKPVQTRDGRKARIICTDIKDDTPILAAVDCGTFESVEHYYRSGLVNGAVGSQDDLINTPTIPKGLRGLAGSSHGVEVALFSMENITKHLEEEGLVVVPIEATQEMILAFAHVRELNGASMDAWKDAIAAWGEE